MNTSTKRQIIEIISDVSGVDSEELTPETYIADLALDSLDCMDIQVQLCNKFGIGNYDEVCWDDEYATINDIINRVKEKL